jgi:hypothetical protein
MNPMVIGAIVAVVASIIANILSLFQKGGELEDLFAALKAELDQVLVNQLAMFACIKDIQSSLDEIHDLIKDEELSQPAMFFVIDSYSRSNALRAALSDLKEAPNPKDSPIWKRIGTYATELPIDAQATSETSTLPRVKPQLVGSVEALMHAALALEVVYKEYKKWTYAENTLVRDILRPASDALGNLLMQSGIAYYIDDPQHGTVSWIAKYEADMRKLPLGKKVLDLLPNTTDAATLTNTIDFMSPLRRIQQTTIENTADLVDADGNVISPGEIVYRRDYQRRLISIPITIEYTEAAHGGRLITVKIAGSHDWVEHAPWSRTTRMSTTHQVEEGSEENWFEDDPDILKGYTETDITPAAVELRFKSEGNLLGSRNAMTFLQSSMTVAIETARRLKTAVDGKVETLKKEYGK